MALKKPYYIKWFPSASAPDMARRATESMTQAFARSLMPRDFSGTWSRLQPGIFVGLSVTCLVSWLVLSLERTSDNARFSELAEQRLDTVRINLNAALDTLSVLSDHFAVTAPNLTRREGFRRLAAPVVARHPFIQALEWIPRLTYAEKDAYERAARQDGLADFRLTERDAGGGMAPVARRGEYFPVFYVEPVAPNIRALGFDLASNEVRKQALEAARDNGQMTVTGRIVLVQEQGDQFGTLIFAPVFSGQAATVAQRRQSLIGYMLGVFRLGKFIETEDVSGKKSPFDEMVNLHLYDLSAPADTRQLYPPKTEISPQALTSGLYAAETMNVAGRTWQLIATPSAAFRRTTVPLNAVATLLMGLLATAFIVYRQKTEIERAESSARFAHEIARAKQQLSEAHRIARLAFLEFDPSKGVWLLGEGAAAMLDIDAGRKAGVLSEVFAKVGPEDRQRLMAALTTSGPGSISLELPIGERVVQVVGEVAAQATAPGLLTLQDVTQRRQAENERAALMARMAETGRLESLGTLAGGVAHEINTPAQFIGDNLAFIKDWLPRLLHLAQTARQAADTGEWSEVAQQAKSMKYDFAAQELPLAADQGLAGIARISTIVQAIKEFSYPSGTVARPFDLNHAVTTAGTVTRNQWKYVAELNLDLAPDLPPLTGIEGEINQVLINLILNAAQAIEEKGGNIPGRIDVRTRAVDGSIVLEVADTGCGVAAENRGRLFELFFTTKPPGKGTGQGLAITKAIVLRHGGEISVVSEPGAGATFRIVLQAAGAQQNSEEPD